MKRVLLMGALVLFFAGGIFWSCQKDEVANPEELSLKSGEIVTDFVSWCSEPAVYKITAAQTTDAGQLLVSNNGEYMRIEYVPNAGFTLGTVHLWVGTDLSLVPKTKKGIPVPGQFPYSGNATTGYVFFVPIPAGANCDETPVYIFAHAEVSNATLWGDTHQTGWSEGTTFGTTRWGWYSTATLCCEPLAGSAPECTEWQTETGFGGEAAGAGSAWWFYYDGIGVEKIYAGQNTVIGTVEYTGGKMQITLVDGWELQNVSESVKIQGYTTLPTGRPAAGQFTTYKGTSLNPEIGAYAYYVIHLDVRKCTTWQ